MNRRKCLLLLIALLPLLSLHAKDNKILARLFAWTDSVRRATTFPDTLRAQRHMQYDFSLPRRNVFLATVPHMHPFVRSERRQFHGELFSSVTATERGPISSFELLHLTNLPRRRLPLVPVQAYLTPHPFATTIVGDHLLSPLHSANRRFYRYSIETDSANCTRVRFRPRIKNTQTVEGEAAVVDSSGQVLWCRFDGEYDHVQFSLRATMDTAAHSPLHPSDTQVDAKFSFLGNKVLATLTTTEDTTSATAIDSLRVASQIQQGTSSADSHHSQRRINRTAENVWEAIHENMLRRISSDFGSDERARFSVGPLFNPLYFGYSKSRGVTYRLNADFSAQISRRCNLFLGLSGGYSFKLDEIYLNTPLRFTFNRRRNAFVQAIFGAGNRITDSGVADKLKQLPKTDSVRFDEMQLTYFRNLSLRIESGCNLTPNLSFKVGGVFHRRIALRRQAFRDANQPTVYRTFAPVAEIIARPWGENGPQFQADVEHGMRHIMHAVSGYERVELNALHTFALPCTRMLNLWAGTGFYAAKRGSTYFLDYANFRRNNLSGGWRDEQTGEFELLNAHWYNASPYYARLNATYESPLLMLSFVPWVGRFVERERLQLSVLAVERLRPYVECGYGMRTRLFSAGIFASFSHRGYEDVGLKFGFELFENW